MNKTVSIKKFAIISLCLIIATSSLTYVIAQTFSSPDLWLDDFPATASYVIKTDGYYYWAVNASGAICWESTNTSSVINSAIIASASGAKLFIKSGDYILDSTIVLNQSIIIEGEVGSKWSQDSFGVAFIASGSVANMFSINGTSETKLSNIQIKNIKLDGNNTATNGFYLTYATMINIDDFCIENLVGTAIYLDTYSQNIRFNFGDIRSVSTGLYVAEGSYTHLITCEDVWLSETDTFGVHINGNARNLNFERVAFTHCDPIALYAKTFRTLVIDTCWFESTDDYAIVAANASDGPQLIVKNCMFLGTGINDIILGQNGYQTHGGLIQGNQFINTGDSAIYLAFRGADDVQFIDNSFSGQANNIGIEITGSTSTRNYISGMYTSITTPISDGGKITEIVGSGYSQYVTSITNTSSTTFLFEHSLRAAPNSVLCEFNAVTMAEIKGYSASSNSTHTTVTIYAEDGKTLPATMTIVSVWLKYIP